MSRYHHPVKGIDLLRGPELMLHHPAEVPDSESVTSYDEGAGCGFDNLSPDAYAERWVDVAEGATPILRWFVRQLRNLGWHPAETVPLGGVASLAFQRDPDERLGVLLQGHGEWWKDPMRLVHWDAGTNRLRVHLAVDGELPDGRRGQRVG